MNWITFWSVFLLITIISAAAQTSNYIEDNRPIQIDPILRKALLKALSTLEKESEEEKESSSTLRFDKIGTTTVTPSPTKQSDEILEESTPSDQVSSVQFHSFVVQQGLNNSDSDSDEIIKTIVISTPQMSLMPPKESPKLKNKNDDNVIINFSNLDPVKENDIKIETVQLARSVTTSVQTNEITSDKKVNSQKGSESKSAPFTKAIPSSTQRTTTTTTTTTKRPEHNADGENIEHVKENDVQIYQAPLVAAFTVQQDELGLPRNIIPLFKQAESQSVSVSQRNSFNNQFTSNSNNNNVNNNANSISSNQFNTKDNVLQISQSIQPAFNPFEQRQRELEQQIVYLQNQNRQQEQYLRQQQFFQEQQSSQRQQQLLLEQRIRLEEGHRQQIQRYEQEQLAQRVNNQIPRLAPPPQARPSTNVQFVPSVSVLPPIVSGISIQQQVPVREPVDFLSTNPPPAPFTQLQQTQKLPLQLSTVQQPPIKTFQTFNLNNIPQPENLPQPSSLQRHRVFRHEQQTANPGFNNNQENNFFRSFQPYQQNSQLQNLLFQSGVSGRSQEDLNIISKILSLNHGIPSSNNNFLDESRRFVRHTQQ